jgi:hypothetical protein
MAFKAQYENVPRGGKEEIPVHEMLERIQPEIALELCVQILALFEEKNSICILYTDSLQLITMNVSVVVSCSIYRSFR